MQNSSRDCWLVLIYNFLKWFLPSLISRDFSLQPILERVNFPFKYILKSGTNRSMLSLKRGWLFQQCLVVHHPSNFCHNIQICFFWHHYVNHSIPKKQLQKSTTIIFMGASSQLKPIKCFWTWHAELFYYHRKTTVWFSTSYDSHVNLQSYGFS